MAERWGLVYDFVPGELLFTAILRSPRQAGALIRQMARAQVRINQTVNTDLPGQSARLGWLVGRADIRDDQKNRIKSFLASVKNSGHICHGDFHAGNLMVYEDRYVALDWMNSYAGNPETDLLRSYLMLVSPYIPLKLPPLKKLQFRLFKKRMGRLYLKEYLRHSRLKKADLDLWWPVVAAARLDDHVPGEARWLKGIIRKKLRQLKKSGLAVIHHPPDGPGRNRQIP